MWQRACGDRHVLARPFLRARRGDSVIAIPRGESKKKNWLGLWNAVSGHMTHTWEQMHSLSVHCRVGQFCPKGEYRSLLHQPRKSPGAPSPSIAALLKASLFHCGHLIQADLS